MRRDAAVLALAASLLLGACAREKSFDERYAEARKAIASSAAAIDSEIASHDSDDAEPRSAVRPTARPPGG